MLCTMLLGPTVCLLLRCKHTISAAVVHGRVCRLEAGAAVRSGLTSAMLGHCPAIPPAELLRMGETRMDMV